MVNLVFDDELFPGPNMLADSDFEQDGGEVAECDSGMDDVEACITDVNASDHPDGLEV